MGAAHRRTATIALTLVVAALAAVAPAGAQEATPRPPDVGYVGDSIGVESEVEVRRELRGTRPFTVLARTNGAYVEWARRHWVRSILRDPPSVLVVQLGHGDANKYIPVGDFRAQVRGFLAEVAPRVDCIRWFDLRERITYYPPVNVRAARYNRVLRQEVARRPGVEVVHYSAWVDLLGDRRFERDFMHLTQEGEDEYARWVRRAADGCDPALASGPFWDVPDHHPAAPAVRWLAERRIVLDDFGNRTFRAELGDEPVALDRRDLARWLWRRAGRPAAPAPPWADVPPGLRPAVGWVAEAEILPGLADGSYRPHRPVTRGELLRALWLLAGSPTGHPAPPWTDVPGRLAAAAAWAHDTGVVSGFRNGTLRPALAVTRAQAATWIAPPDLPDPAPHPTRSGPYRPPRVLGGDAPQGPYYLDRCTDFRPRTACA